MDVVTETHQISNAQIWKEFTLKNDRGMQVSILDFGGIITGIYAPDADGHLENVVVSFRDYEDYLTKNAGYFGALIGRVAGRIEGSAFELDGETYKLTPNEGNNHLHGGENGFHQVVWKTRPFHTDKEAGLELMHHSPDGEGGYPGDLDVKVIYTLTNDNALTVTYEAVSSKKTPLTLTNHSYFNLSGGLKENVRNHHVIIDSSKFVELDERLIPTGEIIDSTGTPFDFRKGRKIDDGITSDNQQNIYAGEGYDHYFIFDHHKPESVQVIDENSRRKLTVETDQPGMVMYTSSQLGEDLELRERKSARYLGICLETQASPASLHHDGFPSCLIEANEPYRKQTTFSFGLTDSEPSERETGNGLL